MSNDTWTRENFKIAYFVFENELWFLHQCKSNPTIHPKKNHQKLKYNKLILIKQ